MTEHEIIKGQCIRNLRGLGKTSLVLLEESHNHIKILEKLLIEMGITKYEDSTFSYNKDRKVILDRVGDAEREMISLINSFNIQLKRD